MKRALITGITGQDGSYLAELLVGKGYRVAGLHLSGAPLTFIEPLRDRITLYEGDITDQDILTDIVGKEKPDELYNLASIATVAKPWEDPLRVLAVTGLAPVAMLDILKRESPQIKFFQASSAEMFGDPEESPQDESTPYKPRSPYGLGKLMAHLAVEQYRAEYGLFAVSGILFNHESPRRAEGFVTRKITKTLARIRAGIEKELIVGNLNAVRDWGFAEDYAEAMWRMLQAKAPEDYVIASGQTHTVRDFINAAAQALVVKITWEGEGEAEIGRDEKGSVIVRVSKEFFRPVEKVRRCGNMSKIQKELGWKPKTRFEDLVRMMVEADSTVH